MMDSSIVVDTDLACLIAQLARCGPPAFAAIQHAATRAELALDQLCDDSSDDVTGRAHRAYLAALAFAKLLERLAIDQPTLGDCVGRLRRTASRMLDLIERLPVTDRDRSLRRGLLG